MRKGSAAGDLLHGPADFELLAARPLLRLLLLGALHVLLPEFLQHPLRQALGMHNCPDLAFALVSQVSERNVAVGANRQPWPASLGRGRGLGLLEHEAPLEFRADHGLRHLGAEVALLRIPVKRLPALAGEIFVLLVCLAEALAVQLHRHVAGVGCLLGLNLICGHLPRAALQQALALEGRAHPACRWPLACELLVEHALPLGVVLQGPHDRARGQPPGQLWRGGRLALADDEATLCCAARDLEELAAGSHGAHASGAGERTRGTAA
mmetsp:Transcript_43307/g.123467  ORF Transcript_43307/g.123467 Transcript_43307/m.123467 type:complete len:267 (-) Transcript_43307:25-825(-)